MEIGNKYKNISKYKLFKLRKHTEHGKIKEVLHIQLPPVKIKKHNQFITINMQPQTAAVKGRNEKTINWVESKNKLTGFGASNFVCRST